MENEMEWRENVFFPLNNFGPSRDFTKWPHDMDNTAQANVEKTFENAQYSYSLLPFFCILMLDCWRFPRSAFNMSFDLTHLLAY